MFWYFVILLGTHWLADFSLQTDWQATYKYQNNRALLNHVLTYTTCIAIVSAVMFGIHFIHLGRSWLFFVVINGVLHLVTDYFSSRLKAKLLMKQNHFWLYTVIGLDQLFHQSTLVVTLWYFWS